MVTPEQRAEGTGEGRGGGAGDGYTGAEKKRGSAVYFKSLSFDFQKLEGMARRGQHGLLRAETAQAESETRDLRGGDVHQAGSPAHELCTAFQDPDLKWGFQGSMLGL